MRDDAEMQEMTDKDLERAVRYGRGNYCRRAAQELSERGIEAPVKCKVAKKKKRAARRRK